MGRVGPIGTARVLPQHKTRLKSRQDTRQDTLHRRQRLCVMVRCVLAWSKLHSLLAAARCIVAPCDPYREHGTERPRQGGLCTKCAGTWILVLAVQQSPPTNHCHHYCHQLALATYSGRLVNYSTARTDRSPFLIQARGPSDRPHDIYFCFASPCLSPLFRSNIK